MLKQIKLRNRKKILESQLRKVRETKSDFEKREAEMAAALEEAETEEDMKLIEAEIADLELELKENDIEGEETKLSDEIEKIEGELRELDEKINTQKPGDNGEGGEKRERKEGESDGMRRRGVFGVMTREQQHDMVKREDVREFLSNVRGLKEEKRSVAGAELAIPTYVMEVLRDTLHQYSKLIGKVNLKPISGKARQHVIGAVPEGIWTEAVGKLNELDFSINQIEMDGYKVGGYIPVDNSTLEDSDINLMAEIMYMLGQAIGMAVDKAIVYGTGKKMPLGIVTRLVQAAKPSDWDENAPEWKNLSVTNVLKIDGTKLTGVNFFKQLILNTGAAKANYSTGEKLWIMNSKTKMEILAEALAFNAAGALVAGMNNTMPVVGGEIIELEFIPDNDMIFGYSSLYLLVERAGGTFAPSEHVRFIEDQTVYKGTARYDGQPVMGEAFIVQNIRNTAPTPTVAFAPDDANKPETPEEGA